VNCRAVKGDKGRGPGTCERATLPYFRTKVRLNLLTSHERGLLGLGFVARWRARLATWRPGSGIFYFVLSAQGYRRRLCLGVPTTLCCPSVERGREERGRCG
jgi:hypothetical protein